MLFHEEVLDRFVNHFRNKRKELQPEEVPQEELIKTMTEKIELNLKEFKEDLTRNRQFSKRVNDILERQEESFSYL